MTAERLAGTVASHFYELPEAMVNAFSAAELELILAGLFLKVKNEDSLCAYLMARAAEDSEFLKLLRFVRFDLVSPAIIDSVRQRLVDGAAHLDARVWNAVLRALADGTPWYLRTIDSRHVEQRIHRLDRTGPGLIAYLTDKGHGNPHERGLVAVTASPPYTSQQVYAQVHLVLDPAAATGYISQAQSEPFVQIAFADRDIVVTQYRVRSWYPGRQVGCNMRSWNLEGSGPGDERWEPLDQRQPPGTNDLKDSVDKTYDVDPTKYRKWRKIKLTQTGNDSSGWGGLTLSWIEFYGVLFE